MDDVCPVDSPASKASGKEADCNDAHHQVSKRLIEISKTFVLSEASMELQYCPAHCLSPESGAGKRKHCPDIRSKDCCRDQSTIMAHLILEMRGMEVDSGDVRLHSF